MYDSRMEQGHDCSKAADSAAAAATKKNDAFGMIRNAFYSIRAGVVRKRSVAA